MNLTETVRFRRRHLPHWEVKGARYFVTVRCADSLPREAVERLEELDGCLGAVEPRSKQFAALQREVFRTLEEYLDSGHGSCPLRRGEIAEIIVKEFALLEDWDIRAEHFTIMPNHWHAVLVPKPEQTRSLSAVMKRLKGRTGKQIRAVMGGAGQFWQGEWFDRWIRSDAEFERIVGYVRNNPVKAGLAQTWHDHRWTR